MSPVNPGLPGFFPDPSVCRAGDRYYLANSTFEYFPGLPLHVSDDLQTWTPIGAAIDRADAMDFSAMADSKGLYAPTIRHHDGVFYMVCTLVGDGPESGFIVTATDPVGPWSDPVRVPRADGFDPSLFFFAGKVYWCAARIVRPGDGSGADRDLDPRTRPRAGRIRRGGDGDLAIGAARRHMERSAAPPRAQRLVLPPHGESRDIP